MTNEEAIAAILKLVEEESKKVLDKILNHTNSQADVCDSCKEMSHCGCECHYVVESYLKTQDAKLKELESTLQSYKQVSEEMAEEMLKIIGMVQRGKKDIGEIGWSYVCHFDFRYVDRWTELVTNYKKLKGKQ